jgi:hypothetical protein
MDCIHNCKLEREWKSKEKIIASLNKNQKRIKEERRVFNDKKYKESSEV